jgi:hypothetical protein
MGGAMRNRSFKSRVIAFIVRRLRQHFKTEQHRTLVVDYAHQPEVLGRPIALPSVFSSDTHRRGECDTKAFAWAELGSLLVVSTDGDFVPLSLLHLDKKPTDQISLLRMTTNIAPPGKRGGAAAGAAGSTARRTYEHVHMRSVKDYLASELPAVERPGSVFAVWCMLTGCDFAANLPALGPTKLWQCRHMIQHCAPTENGLMHALCRAYLQLFRNKLGGAVLNEHVRKLDADTAPAMFACIHASVQRSLTLSPRTKKSFWTADRAQVHVRNVLWTLEYWHTQHDYPDPVQPRYGYVRHNNLVLIAGE